MYNNERLFLFASVEPTYFNCHHPFKLLVTIKSAIHEIDERQIIRNTWGAQILQMNMVYYFVVGDSENDTINQLLYDESKAFNDILQINVKEHYHRLTLKTYANIRWILDSCSNDKLVFFTDCDLILIPERLLNFTNYYDESKNEIVGNCWLQQSYVERDKTMPKYVSWSVWRKRTFPPFCSGSAYFMSVNIARKILNVLPNGPQDARWAFKMNFLDDVMFTGVLRERAYVKIQHSQHFKWLGGDFQPKSFCNTSSTEIVKYMCELEMISIVNSIRPTTLFEYCWKSITTTYRNCNSKMIYQHQNQTTSPQIYR